MRTLKVILFLLLLSSCGGEKSNFGPPQALDLILIDSLEILEENGFLQRPSSVALINDTLVGIESIPSKGIWVFDRRSGLESYSILSNEEMGISFRPSKVIWTDFPKISILDGVSKRVHQYNFEKSKGNRHLISTALRTPENVWIKPILLGVFENFGDKFIVENSTNEVAFTSNKYYELTDNFLSFYDREGKHLNDYIPFPDQLRNLNKFIGPGKIVTSGKKDGQKLYISFPFTKSISVFDLKNMKFDENIIEFPNSRFFDFSIPFLDKEVDNSIGAVEYYPVPHYFNDIKFDSKGIFLQSIMKNEISVETHLMKYDERMKKWYETSKKFNLVDLGELAGVINDTLVFVDASMVKKEKKYIKRAVLRPIED